jgi:hypothetical protein
MENEVINLKEQESKRAFSISIQDQLTTLKHLVSILEEQVSDVESGKSQPLFVSVETQVKSWKQVIASKKRKIVKLEKELKVL